MVKILKFSKHCLRIKTGYQSLLTSATFCQWVQLQPAINIATMHLSWAYGCLINGTLCVLRELGLQNCDKWLCNSIIYSTSCETDKRTPSTGWYHWHISLHQNASIISVLFCMIAASALCKNFVPTNESRCLSRSSTNSSRRSQILSSWFWSPQPRIWLNSYLGHTFSASHASIVNMAGQEILIYCVFFMKCWLCIPVFNLESLVIMTRILLWENVLKSLGIAYPNSRTEPPS